MFTFKIAPDGGEPFTVRASSRAITRWEQAGKGRSVGRLHDEMRMTDLVDLAWFAADRAGLTPLDIREFRDQCDVDVERSDDDEDDEAGPTRTAR